MGIERGREEATQYGGPSPSAAHSSRHGLPVRVQMHQQSPMARIKLTHDKIATAPTKFVQVRRWELANADPASILILWEGVMARNCLGHM